MIDLMLLTPFSSETRHSGFLQVLINTYPSPAMFAHRQPTHANGLTRALTASKYSPLHCRDVVRSCLRSLWYFFQSMLMSAGRQRGYIARKILPANHHLKRTRKIQDTSVQSCLKVVHKRTCVLALFSVASEHSPLHLREVVRSQEVEEHCVRSRLRTL